MSPSAVVLTGGIIVEPEGERQTNLWIKDGLIERVGPDQPSAGDYEKIAVSGCYVTPGLFDLQVNGGFGCDLWADPSPEQFTKMARAMLSRGVTSFLPTLITDSVEHLHKNIQFLESLGAGQLAGTFAPDGRRWPRLPGIHLEGPFLSPEKPGVHPPEHIQKLSIEAVELVLSPSVRLMTVAPETACDEAPIRLLRDSHVVVSLGHSNATYAEARLAFDAGVRLMTHTFNALPGIHHRSPGAVTAALLDERVHCCVIADGLHVAPAIVQLIYKTKGRDRTVLVTDIAQIGTSGGGLVGSSITLDEAVRNLVAWQVCSFADSVRMATSNPASVLGLSDRLGSLKEGALADIVVWDQSTLQVKKVFIAGQLITSSLHDRGMSQLR